MAGCLLIPQQTLETTAPAALRGNGSAAHLLNPLELPHVLRAHANLKSKTNLNRNCEDQAQMLPGWHRDLGEPLNEGCHITAVNEASDLELQRIAPWWWSGRGKNRAGVGFATARIVGTG